MAIKVNDQIERAGDHGAGSARLETRPMCERCRRPLAHCLCASIPSLDSRTRVVVLQHPDESRHALNTARLAVLGLRNAVLHVGRRFDAALWNDGAYETCLLFPGEGARVLMPSRHGEASVVRGVCIGRNPDENPVAPTRPLLLVVPDGTWRHARQLLAAHPDLAALPRVTLPAGTTTRYRVRHAADAAALSTIEAIAAALDALEAPRSFAALLAPFEALVAGQIAAMGEDRYQRHHVRREGSRDTARKTTGR